MSTKEHEAWSLGTLTPSFELIRWLAMSSLKVRMSRTVLTILTITTATAFMMYEFTLPTPTTEAGRQEHSIMLVLSLVVSGVGVLNAMLMSVTQRYREIGTMKCLGAVDSLVLYSVLFESAILGLVGAVVGVVLGLIVSTLLGLAEFGGAVFSSLSFGYLPVKILVVLLIGMGLTSFGAFIPALVASRLPPIEAMRGEK